MKAMGPEVDVGWIAPVSKGGASVLVAVWTIVSLFNQVTVSLTEMVMSGGLNE